MDGRYAVFRPSAPCRSEQKPSRCSHRKHQHVSAGRLEHSDAGQYLQQRLTGLARHAENSLLHDPGFTPESSCSFIPKLAGQTKPKSTCAGEMGRKGHPEAARPLDASHRPMIGMLKATCQLSPIFTRLEWATVSNGRLNSNKHLPSAWLMR
jgi:hypothetical protein